MTNSKIYAELYITLPKEVFLFKAIGAVQCQVLFLFCLLSHLISCNPLNAISEIHERNATTSRHIAPLQKLAELLVGVLMLSRRKAHLYGNLLGQGLVNLSHKHRRRFTLSEKDNRPVT